LVLETIARHHSEGSGDELTACALKRKIDTKPVATLIC
jgi:hypothetical protein